MRIVRDNATGVSKGFGYVDFEVSTLMSNKLKYIFVQQLNNLFAIFFFFCNENNNNINKYLKYVIKLKNKIF